MAAAVQSSPLSKALSRWPGAPAAWHFPSNVKHAVAAAVDKTQRAAKEVFVPALGAVVATRAVAARAVPPVPVPVPVPNTAAAAPDVILMAPSAMENLDRDVILYHRERRCVWYHNAAQGLGTGFCLGAAFGWIPAVVLIPTSHATSLLLWPASIVGGALAGATIGATGKFHFSPARPDDFRKHTFWQFGVVATRQESAALVAEMQVAGALAPTRFRKLWDLQPAQEVLAACNLSEEHRARARRILEIFEQESRRRAPFLEEAERLWKEIEALHAKPNKQRSPADQDRINALIEAAALLNTQLSKLPALPSAA